MKECQHCKNCYPDDVSTCPEEGMPTIHTIAGEPILDGKYHLESRVGQGGMGIVYKARHVYLKTPHAVKVILPDLVGNDPQLVQRFQQEALAAAAIRHQNVVNVSDFGVAMSTMPFLVMEFVEGEDLHDFLEREGRLSIEQSFEITRAICAGIGAAHEQGIVHRDLKPLNIMVVFGKSTLGESIKILDFGLAKIKSGELLGSFIQAQTTGLMGSPYYMAPEQWSDEDLDAQSDIYSIGVMLYQMLAGEVPFKGSSIPSIMKKHLTDPPPKFIEFDVEMEPEIEAAVLRALEKDRKDRTKSVDDFVGELSAAIGVVGNETLADRNTIAISNLRILTNPPNSEIHLNEESVGITGDDGWLELDTVEIGNHRLRVSHEGFEDWNKTIFCDGNLSEVVAKLETLDKPIQYADAKTQVLDSSISQSMPTANSIQFTAPNAPTVTGDQDVPSMPPQVEPENNKNKWYFSPVVYVFSGISLLFLLLAVSGVGLYIAGPFGNSNEQPVDSEPSVSVDKSLPEVPKNDLKGGVKAEMVAIPGGQFTMGRNVGAETEQKEHQVTVKAFSMDKYEVTNSQYFKFIEETGRKAPPHFVNGKPIEGREDFPVSFVSLDDARAFAEWRSKQEGKKLRLPTEQEWEYAARSGSLGTLYPWGNSISPEMANIGKVSDASKPVGSFPKGANKWGVDDLIGNVWEWTDSAGKSYPGSPVEISSESQVVRGGGFFDETKGENGITSTFRGLVAPTKKDKSLGFRLVTSQ